MPHRNAPARWLLTLPVIVLLAMAAVACDDNEGPGSTDEQLSAQATPTPSPTPTPEPAPDSDDDGVPNAQDECPEEQEDGRWSDGSDGCPDGLDDLLTLAASDINAFWEQEFDEQGVDYLPPRGFRGYDQEIETACGTAVPQNAFYCPLDHSIYFDTNFLGDELEATGDFGPVFVVAHEWGHLVQGQLGILVDPTRFSIQNELQADCFAGAYTEDASVRGLLEEGDLDEAISSLLAAGDPEGTPWYDPQAHGSSEERVRAFRAGIDGSVEACLRI